MMSLKIQLQLMPLQTDALFCLIKKFLINLKAYIVPVLFDTSHSGSA